MSTTAPPGPISAAARPAFTLKGWHVLAIFVAFFGLVFTANGVMTYVAVTTFRGVDSSSPYQSARSRVSQLADARAQAERGWAAELKVERTSFGLVSLRFSPRDAEGAAVTGLVVSAKLEWPADSHHDRAVRLVEETPGVYAAEVLDLPAGLWDVAMEAARGPETLYRSRNRVVLR